MAASIHSFNTQPRGGGCNGNIKPVIAITWFQHTAARRRLLKISNVQIAAIPFQHTAARRRLRQQNILINYYGKVSTHSRAEAAASFNFKNTCVFFCFNTQPRGGGCKMKNTEILLTIKRFNTQPRGGGCFCFGLGFVDFPRFNTQPRGGGCS